MSLRRPQAPISMARLASRRIRARQCLAQRCLKRVAVAVALSSLTLVAACQPEQSTNTLDSHTNVPTLLATRLPDATSAPASGQLLEPSDSGWTDSAPGVQTRHWRVAVAANQPLADLTAVRLDPARVRFHTGYRPDQPPTLEEWLADVHPLAAINGGFFTESYQTTALVVSAGAASGESYVGRGGMFAVDNAGQVTLRSLADQPYDPNETPVEALQSWPMLVKPGGVAAYSGDDSDRARRSVVALDRDGRVLLLVCASSTFTLRALSDWLAASDLGIDAALNLDGGSSTGLSLGDAVRVAPFGRLPLVLFARPR